MWELATHFTHLLSLGLFQTSLSVPTFPAAATANPITTLPRFVSPLSLLTFYCYTLIDTLLGLSLDCITCGRRPWLPANSASDSRLLCRVERVRAGLKNMSAWKFVKPAVMLE